MRRRDGKTLIEMMLVVTGVAALAATAGTTLHAVGKVGGAARAAAESGSALSRLHRTLCEDAAAAETAAVNDDAADGRLTLTAPDGSAVVYAIDGPAITRTRSGAKPGQGERFAVGAADVSFAAADGRVSIAFDRAGTPDGASDGRTVELAVRIGGTR